MTKKVSDDEIIIPDDAHLFVAKGAALDSVNYNAINAEK